MVTCFSSGSTTEASGLVSQNSLSSLWAGVSQRQELNSLPLSKRSADQALSSSFLEQSASPVLLGSCLVPSLFTWQKLSNSSWMISGFLLVYVTTSLKNPNIGHIIITVTITIIILCVWLFCLNACLCNLCMHSVLRGQNWALGPQELELLHTGAPSHLAISPAHQTTFDHMILWELKQTKSLTPTSRYLV